MRLKILVFTLFLPACGEVRSFDETSAQFMRDRADLQELAQSALACKDASQFSARETDRADCGGEISRQLHSLGYQSASVDAGRWRVAFVNGNDGASIGGVVSGIAYHRVPGLPEHGEAPLTEPPHQWFYFQHD